MRRNHLMPNRDFTKRHQTSSGSQQMLEKDKRAIYYSYNFSKQSSQEGIRSSSLLSPLTQENRTGRQFDLERNSEIVRKQSLPTIRRDSSGNNSIASRWSDGSNSLGNRYAQKQQEKTTSLSSLREKKVSLSTLKTTEDKAKPQTFEPRQEYNQKAFNYSQSPRYEPKLANGFSCGYETSYREVRKPGWRTNGTNITANRKAGLSAVENKELMYRNFRKKAVVDSTDEAHYQRQFLRVLNKRF